jgi:UDP-3-O-[3-hydroxymyristoyl] N-acetylglucosamine deacetylase
MYARQTRRTRLNLRRHQRTVAETLVFEGVALHSGVQAVLRIHPARAGHGLVFTRTDVEGQPRIPAIRNHVIDTRFATTLGKEFRGSVVSVRTVEHVLSALYAFGVDNALLEISGEEIPVLDGSAGPFVDELCRVGLREQAAPVEHLVIRREVKVSDGDKWAMVGPSTKLTVRYEVDFDHPLVSSKPVRLDVLPEQFANYCARARTFGFKRDVDEMRRRGLALGGSLENAVVIDDYEILNPDGLRFADEFVRHKILDAVGDMALLGKPLIADVSMSRSGHALNAKLVEAILSDGLNYDIVVGRETERCLVEGFPIFGSAIRSV